MENKELLMKFCQYVDRVDKYLHNGHETVVNWFIKSIERKEPIFISEDGFDVFYGDTINVVDTNLKQLIHTNFNVEDLKEKENHILYFSILENAKEHLKKIGKENLDLVSLGYHKMYTGGKMPYYKLVKDNKEYLIVDAGHLVLDMIWTNENKLQNANFTDEEKEEMKSEIRMIEILDKELSEDEEKTFFTQHAIKEPEPIAIPKRKGGRYGRDEVTEILNILNEFDFTYDYRANKKAFKITQEMCDFANENDYTPNILQELVGYEIKHKADGSHKNDGQMVEYTFTLKSPKGKKTVFSTEMCLMCGWNVCDDLIIK